MSTYLNRLEEHPMEHRYSVRIETGLRTLIYRQNILVAVGRIKNYSKFGLFIETGYADPGIFQTITLEVLEHQSPSKLLRHNYNVRTIRKSERGFGVEFDFIDAAAEKTLKRLIGLPENRQDNRIFLPAVSPVHVKSSKNKTLNQVVGSKNF